MTLDEVPNATFRALGRVLRAQGLESQFVWQDPSGVRALRLRESGCGQGIEQREGGSTAPALGGGRSRPPWSGPPPLLGPGDPGAQDPPWSQIFLLQCLTPNVSCFSFCFFCQFKTSNRDFVFF